MSNTSIELNLGIDFGTQFTKRVFEKLCLMYQIFFTPP
jgi:hypothetical protein